MEFRNKFKLGCRRKKSGWKRKPRGAE